MNRVLCLVAVMVVLFSVLASGPLKSCGVVDLIRAHNRQVSEVAEGCLR